jgi:hypothetical protein
VILCKPAGLVCGNLRRKGRALRLPLKLTLPALAQEIVFPPGSVIVIRVLLNDALMCATPTGIFFRSFCLPLVTALRAILIRVCS